MTAPIAIRRLNAADQDFAQHLDHLLSWESVSDDAVNQRVLDIIKAVRERGDAALVEFTKQFDSVEQEQIAVKLHTAAEDACELEYERTHTGFCRVITVTEDDLQRLQASRP